MIPGARLPLSEADVFRDEGRRVLPFPSQAQRLADLPPEMMRLKTALSSSSAFSPLSCQGSIFVCCCNIAKVFVQDDLAVPSSGTDAGFEV